MQAASRFTNAAIADQAVLAALADSGVRERIIDFLRNDPPDGGFFTHGAGGVIGRGFRRGTGCRYVSFEADRIGFKLKRVQVQGGRFILCLITALPDQAAPAAGL